MPTKPEAIKAVEQALKDLFEINEVTPETTCKDLGLDSLDMIEFLIMVEDHLGLDLDEDQFNLEDTTTLDQFAEELLRVGHSRAA